VAGQKATKIFICNYFLGKTNTDSKLPRLQSPG